MMDKLGRVAAVQMASGPNVNANLLEAERLIGQAVDAGAQLVVLPENFALMGLTERDNVRLQEADEAGPIQEFLACVSDRFNIWLVGGTVPLQSSVPEKVRAACLVYNQDGERVCRYDKMHLFDVQMLDNNERYTESETIEPGDSVKVIDTPFGRLGLAVCYDLRFPELFRKLVDGGAEILAIPSAFTAITGKAHWKPLIRSRAIENTCYVIAAAQGGYHLNGRETHGHSMIVDPWGQVLSQLPTGTGIVYAEIDPNRIQTVRRNFPVLNHRKIKCL